MHLFGTVRRATFSVAVTIGAFVGAYWLIGPSSSAIGNALSVGSIYATIGASAAVLFSLGAHAGDETPTDFGLADTNGGLTFYFVWTVITSKTEAFEDAPEFSSKDGWVMTENSQGVRFTLPHLTQFERFFPWLALVELQTHTIPDRSDDEEGT